MQTLCVNIQPAELAALFKEQGAAEELVAVCEERGIKLPMTELNYSSLGWGDAEAAQMAEVLASGAAPRLERLFLDDNEIGDKGCKALAAALGKEGAAPRLETLYLQSNKIGDEGCKALAAALGKESAAPRLETLYLDDNEIGDEGCKALAAALKEGGAPSLKARDATLATRTFPAQ